MGAPATAVNNLPRPLTRFVGREAELAEAAALLAEARLLTLTGPGGGGKTRLALQLATTVSEDFPDGVWFVDLSSLSDGEFVLDQVAITMKVDHPGRGGTLAEAVAHRLAQRRALVVLDNCEHVVDEAAEITAGLLTAAPALKVVATSREPLDVGGEVTWNVPPLCEEDALELFVDRARLARPRFELREEDDDAARYICRRLDGVPWRSSWQQLAPEPWRRPVLPPTSVGTSGCQADLARPQAGRPPSLRRSSGATSCSRRRRELSFASSPCLQGVSTSRLS